MNRLSAAMLISFLACCTGVIPSTTANTTPTYRPYTTHSSCTTNTSQGLPSCDFDKGYCGSYVSDRLNFTNGVSWRWGNETKIGSHGYIEHDWQPSQKQGENGNFVYLDVANSSAALGSIARMNGYISDPTVKAVCIEFRFATFSDVKKAPAIRVYNLLRNGTEVLIGNVQTNTNGQWRIARVSSCVGARSTISFESEKLSDRAVVALDYITVTKSTLSCRDFETTTISPTTSTTPATTPDQITTPSPTRPSRATGPEVSMVIDPEICTETIETSAKIACNLGYSDKYKEVYVVMILNASNQRMAMMRMGSSITMDRDVVGNRFQVDGFLDNNDVRASYLELTLTNPNLGDSGNYSCVVSYLNEEGLLAQDKTSASLVVNKLDFNNSESVERVMYSLIHRLEKVEAVNEQQKQTINELEAKQKYRSSFLASPIQKNNNRRPLGPNMVIIFDRVLQKEGQGYDEKTGVYTAPIHGLYAFHLTIGTWSKSSNSYTEVVMNVNDVPTVLLRTNNDRNIGGGNQDQNSMSLVVALNPGDTVKVTTVAGTASSEEIYDYLSKFSGYLIRAY